MEGDDFEMEDQRNWTDASFKTYCPPLESSKNLTMLSGQRFRQVCTLQIDSIIPIQPNTFTSSERIRLHVQYQPVGQIPAIGTGIAKREESLASDQIAELKRLKLDHLRVDLQFSQPGWEQRLQEAVFLAKSIEAGLEIALHLGGQPNSQIDALARLLLNNQDNNPEGLIHRWLIFHEHEKVAPTAWFTEVCRRIKACLPSGPIAGGTDVYFAHINLQPPDPVNVDQLCFSMNPQVHAGDNDHIMETLPMQGLLLRSARRLRLQRPIVVSPVTLKPRFNPNTWVRCDEKDSKTLSCLDRRLHGLFGAAWTLGSLQQMSENGALSVTYYEHYGEMGLLASGSEAVHPVYFVLAGLEDFHGAEMLTCDNSDPQSVAGLVVFNGNRLRVLMANLTARLLSIELSGLHGLGSLHVCDETNLNEIILAPEIFLSSLGITQQVDANGCEINLKPFCLAWLDL